MNKTNKYTRGSDGIQEVGGSIRSMNAPSRISSVRLSSRGERLKRDYRVYECTPRFEQKNIAQISASENNMVVSDKQHIHRE